MSKKIGCLVYPSKYRAEKCQTCELFDGCITKNIPPKEKIVCSNCGFELEIYREFVTSMIDCPVCGSAYE